MVSVVGLWWGVLDIVISYFIGVQIVFLLKYFACEFPPAQFVCLCPLFLSGIDMLEDIYIASGGHRSPAVACWASDYWVASSNPLRGKFRH